MLRPGGRLVVVDFERIEGVSSEWLLGHVRAGKEVFLAEIEEAGFELEVDVVDRPHRPAAEVAAAGESREMECIERFAFYDLAKGAYAVIQTGERRFYGCFMLRKGVIPPEG